MDFVSRRELSRDASTDSVDDWRASMSMSLVFEWRPSLSTSVAKDLVHGLVGTVATRRPVMLSAEMVAVYDA